MVTMNMPNGRGEGYVHQLIVEHPSTDCRDFCAVLSDDPFVLVRQLYFDDDRYTGERVWIDRGDIVLNCSLIGKVMPHYAPPAAAAVPQMARTAAQTSKIGTKIGSTLSLAGKDG
jgi:hypothetical protein